MIRAEFMLLDQGQIVVSGPVENTMITHADVHYKLNFDGANIPLDQQIKTEIIRQQVIAEKMPFDETAVDKYMANIQKMNNLTLEDLENLAAQCNRSFPELKNLLMLNYTYDYFLHHKFRAHLVPTDQEVEEYYEQNPQVEQGYCILQVAFVDYSSQDQEEVERQIAHLIEDNEYHVDISWSDPIKVNITDIAEDKQFVTMMNPGQIKAIQGKKSFELYRLIEKQDARVVPLAERKPLIIDTLNRNMYEDLLKEYEKHMVDNVAIIDLVK
jgi:hypothetical protein